MQGDPAENKRLLDDIIQRMTYGFSTSEKKFNELQQGEFRDFDFKGLFSESVLSFEEQQQKKKTLLIYLSNVKGGSAK